MAKQNNFYIIFLSVSTFLTVVSWIGFNVYHASVTSTVSPSLQLKVQPIEGRFDLQTIENLKKRQVIQPVSESVAPIATAAASPD